jgi:hypothetical protein
MSSPLSFLRPLRYDRVRDVLLVQTDAGAQLAGIVDKLRAIFPGCAVQVLVREADADLRDTLAVEGFDVARWEERFELLSRLRRRRFDAVVLQLGSGGSSELRMLPYLARARYLIAFNDTLDYFPINIFRLTALAHHFALTQGEAGIARSLLWLLRRTVTSCVLAVAGGVVLLVSVGRLYVRGWWRRRRRAAATRGTPWPA